MPSGGQHAKLFINYRREDTAPYAGRLYDRLVAHFGADQVFMDIDKIEPGEDFVEVIQRKVGACEIAIISIGPNWLSATDASGQRRLDDSEDFVRMEIVAALERKIRVIPVLVGGARMPRRQDLPEEIASLSRRNAIELSESRFHADVSRLIDSIEKPRTFPEKKAETPAAAVAPVAESAPPEKSPGEENIPMTSVHRPLEGPPPVPVALITETTPQESLPAPEKVPEMPASPPLPGQGEPPYPPPPPKSLAPVLTARKSKKRWAFGCLVCFVLVLLGVLAVRSYNLSRPDRGATLTQHADYGTHLKFNGGGLFYTSSVTLTEARKVGEYLKPENFPPYGVQLDKTGTTYEVRICIKQGAERKESVIAYYQNLARLIRLNVFNRKPVVVHLCDTNMKTLRVVTPD